MVGKIELAEDGFGALWTDEAEPHELVRLANVIRSQIGIKWPARKAAGAVLGALMDSPSCEFFLLREFDLAKKVRGEDCWIPPDPFIGGQWRLIDGERQSDKFAIPDDFKGVSGALYCLLNSYRIRQLNLDAGLAGRIAILKADAERMFGFDGAATVHRLRPVQPVVPEAPAPKPPAGMEHDGASLLRQQNELKAAHHKSPTKQLAKDTGLNERDVQRRMKPHRPTPTPQPCLGNVWAGSGKVHRSK